MDNNPDLTVSAILCGEELFLSEIGRFSRLFSDIEAMLVKDAIALGRLTRDAELKKVAASAARLRTHEKRDLLKLIVGEISFFYSNDCKRLNCYLDELGGINRLRRAIIHGRVRWSSSDQMPVFVGDHGATQSAWPGDLIDLNIRVLTWRVGYCREISEFLRTAMLAYDRFLHRMLQHANLPSDAREILLSEKRKVACMRYRDGCH